MFTAADQHRCHEKSSKYKAFCEVVKSKILQNSVNSVDSERDFNIYNIVVMERIDRLSAEIIKSSIMIILYFCCSKLKK